MHEQWVQAKTQLVMRRFRRTEVQLDRRTIAKLENRSEVRQLAVPPFQIFDLKR